MSTTWSSALRALAAAAALALLGTAIAVPAALACGWCYGDRVGSVYDAALIASARKRGLTGVFAEFRDAQGKLTAIPDTEMARVTVLAAVRKEAGAKDADVRLKTDAVTALYFAYPPARGTKAAVLARISKRLALDGWTLAEMVDPATGKPAGE